MIYEWVQAKRLVEAVETISTFVLDQEFTDTAARECIQWGVSIEAAFSAAVSALFATMNRMCMDGHGNRFLGNHTDNMKPELQALFVTIMKTMTCRRRGATCIWLRTRNSTACFNG